MRKLIFFGVIVGTAASIPLLQQSNPAMLSNLLRTAPVVSADAPKPAPSNLVGKKVRIADDGRGHFVGDFKLNGRTVEAMIDTGATVVALNQSTARRVGVQLTPADFVHRISTANGEAKAASIVIKSVQIGRITVGDVQAVVLEDGALEGTLIGMSFLRRLDRFGVEDSDLILQQ